MANYERTIKSTIWSTSWFEGLTAQEVKFYFLLHCGEETSDTSIFPLSVKRIAYIMDMDKDEARALIDEFQMRDIILYDYEHEEVLVKTYFFHNPPRGGLMYLGYKKDLAKIRAKYLIAEAAEIAKGYEITIGFFAALQDYLPDLKESDYKIRATKETADSTRTAQTRGCVKVPAAEAPPGVPVTPDDEEKLPF